LVGLGVADDVVGLGFGVAEDVVGDGVGDGEVVGVGVVEGIGRPGKVRTGSPASAADM